MPRPRLLTFGDYNKLKIHDECVYDKKNRNKNRVCSDSFSTLTKENGVCTFSIRFHSPIVMTLPSMTLMMIFSFYALCISGNNENDISVWLQDYSTNTDTIFLKELNNLDDRQRSWPSSGPYEKCLEQYIPLVVGASPFSLAYHLKAAVIPFWLNSKKWASCYDHLGPSFRFLLCYCFTFLFGLFMIWLIIRVFFFLFTARILPNNGQQPDSLLQNSQLFVPSNIRISPPSGGHSDALRWDLLGGKLHFGLKKTGKISIAFEETQYFFELKWSPSRGQWGTSFILTEDNFSKSQLMRIIPHTPPTITFPPMFFIEFPSFGSQMMGGGAAEATGMGFVCFIVINSRVLSANRVDLAFFYFINFPILPPPPSQTHVTYPLWCPYHQTSWELSRPISRLSAMNADLWGGDSFVNRFEILYLHPSLHYPHAALQKRMAWDLFVFCFINFPVLLPRSPQIPERPGICLLCRQIICVGSDCCTKNGQAEAFRVGGGGGKPAPGKETLLFTRAEGKPEVDWCIKKLSGHHISSVLSIYF